MLNKGLPSSNVVTLTALLKGPWSAVTADVLQLYVWNGWSPFMVIFVVVVVYSVNIPSDSISEHKTV